MRSLLRNFKQAASSSERGPATHKIRSNSFLLHPISLYILLTGLCIGRNSYTTFQQATVALHTVYQFQDEIDDNLLPNYDNYFNNLLCKLYTKFSCEITDYLKYLGPSRFN